MADEHKESGGGEGHGGGGHGGGGHGGGHGGGGGSHEEHEGAPEWLISFADNVALMMGFFVILLAMNMDKPSTGGVGGEGKYPSDTPTEKMTDFAIEMREAFHNKVDINSTDPHEQELVKRLKERKLQGGTTTQPGVDGDKHNVQATRPSDFVNDTGFAYFLDFDNRLDEEGKRAMGQAAERLKGSHWIVEVRGHVSAVEAKDNKERAMHLAHERAFAAAAELVAQGLAWNQLRIVACADNERDVPRAGSVEQHRSNQRVQIVTTQEQIPPDAYNGSSSNAGGGAVHAGASPE